LLPDLCSVNHRAPPQSHHLQGNFEPLSRENPISRPLSRVLLQLKLQPPPLPLLLLSLLLLILRQLAAACTANKA